MERECRNPKKAVWIMDRVQKRRRKYQRDLASADLEITAIFDRQRELQSSENYSEEQGLTTFRPSNQDDGQGEQERQRALKNLEMLLNSKREQIRKYGHMLIQEGDFYRRHCMDRNLCTCRRRN
jgi:hypothetical protein